MSMIPLFIVITEEKGSTCYQENANKPSNFTG